MDQAAVSGDDSKVVLVQLDLTGTNAYTKLTSAASQESHPKNQIGIVVGGTLQDVQKVSVPITNGSLAVTGFPSADAARQFASQWPGT